MVKCERHRRLTRGSKYVADVAYKDLLCCRLVRAGNTGGRPPVRFAVFFANVVIIRDIC